MQTSKLLFRIVTFAVAATLVVSCSKQSKKTRFLAEADKYFKAGDYDKAKVSYLNVIRLDPHEALAFERLGAMWLDDAAFPRAAAFLVKASELDPKNIENRLRLARCYLAIGQFASAKKEALKLLEQVPDSGDAIIVLTDAARTKEDIQAAAGQLERFPQKDDFAFQLASANLLLNSGDVAGGESELRQALAINPNSSAGHMAMGDLYLLKKDQQQAGEEFRKAADLAPVRSMERLKYAAFALATGDTGETTRIATEMTKQAPDYLPGWTLLAQVALKDKKYDEALSLLENVFSRDPEYIDGRRTQSDVLLAKGDTKKAVEILEGLDNTYPDTPLIKYGLAGAYLANNNLNQAKIVLDQAISINPNYTDAILLLAEINLRSGHGEMAIEPLNNLLKGRPDLKRATLLLAAAYGSLGRYDDAAAVIGEQARLAPQDLQLQMALGLTFRQSKRYDEARQAFEKAAELAPDALAPVDQLLELDLRDKHVDAARQLIRRQFEKTPDSPAAHYFEGKILAYEKKWDAAQAELQKTLLLDPNFSEAYDLLIQSYFATNKIAEAISEAQAEIARHPQNAPALMTLALLYERTNDFAQARNAYEKILSMNPNFVAALNNLAYLDAERLNDLEKAYDLARKARALRPQDPLVSDTLGWVLYKRGEYQQALTVLQESAAKIPDNPEIQFHLGMTAYAMGQTDLAKVALQKAANAEKDFPGKEESKHRLAFLASGTGTSPELSVSRLEQLAKEHPKDAISQTRLGEAYQKQGAFEKAAVAFEQAFKLNPRSGSAASNLAQLYAGPLQNNEKALIYAKKAHELVPSDSQVTSILGKAAYRSGNFAWAYSLLQEAARQRQNDPAILHDLAWAAYSMGRVHEARGAMQTVLTAGADASQVGDAKKFLAFTAVDEDPKAPTAGESEVQKELESNPEYVPALMDRARLLDQRGETKPASQIYSDILRRFPDFSPAQKSLAAIYAENPDDLTKAYDLAIKARKTLSDDPELARILAELNFKRKEFAYAIQLYQQSAVNQPLLAKDLYYLGMAQLQTKHDAEGRQTLQRALAAGLQNPLAQEARQQLAE
jgi:tetratricopeptide (TPR) repeat protein